MGNCDPFLDGFILSDDEFVHSDSEDTGGQQCEGVNDAANTSVGNGSRDENEQEEDGESWKWERVKDGRHPPREEMNMSKLDIGIDASKPADEVRSKRPRVKERANKRSDRKMSPKSDIYAEEIDLKEGEGYQRLEKEEESNSEYDDNNELSQEEGALEDRDMEVEVKAGVSIFSQDDLMEEELRRELEEEDSDLRRDEESTEDSEGSTTYNGEGSNRNEEESSQSQG